LIANAGCIVGIRARLLAFRFERIPAALTAAADNCRHLTLQGSSCTGCFLSFFGGVSDDFRQRESGTSHYSLFIFFPFLCSGLCYLGLLLCQQQRRPGLLQKEFLQMGVHKQWRKSCCRGIDLQAGRQEETLRLFCHTLRYLVCPQSRPELDALAAYRHIVPRDSKLTS
jgi:hypothetical protein